MKLLHLCGLSGALALSLAGVAVPAPVPPAAKETAETELAKLAASKWKVTSRVQAGVEVVAGQDTGGDAILAFSKEGAFSWATSTDEMGKIVRIDPSKNPKEIDYQFTRGTYKDKIQKGLYKFEGDTFIDCCTKPGEDRPTEFKSTKENGYEIMTAKRVKKDE